MRTRLDTSAFQEMANDFDRKAKKTDLVIKAIRRYGALAQGHAEINIARGTKTGRTYTSGSVSHQASAPGEFPARDTGALTVRVEPTDDGADLVATPGYARHLELGTRNMAPRPFLSRSLRDKEREGAEMIKEALEQVMRS